MTNKITVILHAIPTGLTKLDLLIMSSVCHQKSWSVSK